MTFKQAQERNQKIRQFRGMYNRIYNCIPDDILNKLSNKDHNILLQANEIYKDVIKLMNESAGCRHIYYENNICHYCGHKKNSHDKLGKGTYLK